MMTGVPSPLRLDSVHRNPNLYQVVSARLSEAIKEAGLGPGDKIPSERELGEQFGVSRTVIREAIRHLAAKGILEARTGSGVRVASVGHETVSESIELYLTQRGPLDPDKLNEVRLCLELKTTELAALRATDEHLEVIRAKCDELAETSDDPEAASRADVEFHRAIAQASENELFLVLVDSLGDVLLDIRRATLHDPHRLDTTVQQHRRIADALSQRDADGAVEAMSDHLLDSLTALKSALGQHDEDTSKG